MTCREFNDFIMDYRTDELPPEVRARFEHHLTICANCVKYLASYEKAVQLGKTAFSDDDASLPDDVPEALVQAILAARRPT